MGNIIETFPVQIKDGFLKFKELFAQNIPDHEYLLQFTILFKIPWIMAWKFIVIDAEGTTPMSLHRIVSVKWWEKLPVEQAAKMTAQRVVDHFTGTRSFGVQSTIAPPPSQLPTDSKEERVATLDECSFQRRNKKIAKRNQTAPSGIN